MHRRAIAVAALIVPLAMAAGQARADCLWDIGMAERDLMSVERAAPLAADASLPLGPGDPDRFSGAEHDFADRAMLAFGEAPGAAGQPHADFVEGQIVWARDRLVAARRHASAGDMEACAASVDQARQAIALARAAFR